VNARFVAAVERADLIKMAELVLREGADLEARDRFGRDLKQIIFESPMLLPAQKVS